MSKANSFNAKATLAVGGNEYSIYRLDALKSAGIGDPAKLPFSLRILLENLLRTEDGERVSAEDIKTLLARGSGERTSREIAFTPARVILQDFTGVPAVVDLAVMRDAVKAQGKDPKVINPLLPVDLVIDHSVMVDSFASADSFAKNTNLEFERNQERYQLLRWAQKAFQNFRVVPPGTGIVHQVNLERLADVVMTREVNGELQAFPDTLVGTDSHTTMINGLGVLGWGVGGIEAEAAMLGQPISMLIPEVVGFKLTGKLQPGVTATDLVLCVVELLRAKGVVGKFVEFFGPGMRSLSLTDRATLANMAPEYGATMGFFPVDEEALNYLRITGRPEATIQLVEAYTKEQGLFLTEDTPEPVYSSVAELDMGTVETSLAGPKRPQDRVPLKSAKQAFQKVKATFPNLDKGTAAAEARATTAVAEKVDNGSVVIASITSCTNTSNPQVMLGAGVLAKKALAQGLKVKPWVKTSLAPGSKVVIEYLKKADLLTSLEELNFYLVGFGCTTCIGNSGPLPEVVEQEIKERDLLAVSVLSGNRNFEGRIHPLVKANYLASPPLVVAYAIAGTMDIDLINEPLGVNESTGQAVYLKDIWPTVEEIAEAMKSIGSELYEAMYATVFEGEEKWQALKVPEGDTFAWEPTSTYIRQAPYFDDMPATPEAPQDIKAARLLALLGDSVTTDHISPAGSIAEKGPAGDYLTERGVAKKNFNSFGSRRGNHEIMMRGTFANIRLKNKLAPGTEGGLTRLLPSGEQMSIFEAANKYRQTGTPLMIIAGKEYGTGSSRDWAAKGPALLGVRAVIAETYERIHRSNLIGMGVLPLEFKPGENVESLGLSGEEEFSVEGIAEGLTVGKELKVSVKQGAQEINFIVSARLDTPLEVKYYENGGILAYVLRQLLVG